MRQWDTDMHARVAGAIRRARGPRSAQWLADRTAEIGYPITRSQLANYESGRKKGLDITELVVIAAALGVPPVGLLYPELPDGEVDVLPNETLPSDGAVQWFSGESDWGEADLAKLVLYARERLVSIEYADRLKQHLDKAKKSGAAAEDLTLFERMLDGIEDFNRRMREIPGSVVRRKKD